MQSSSNWKKVAKAFWRIDHLLLAMYMIALTGLLMFPISGPDFELLGIESDKWMHIELFGGLAVLLRWNFSGNRHPLFATVGTAFVVAAVFEIGQGLVAYRSAEFWDLIAGVVGALVGAATVHQILASPALQRFLGLLVAIVGFMAGAFFLLADVIGVGDTSQFGLIQIAGMVLGALIAMGGTRVYLIGRRGRF